MEFSDVVSFQVLIPKSLKTLVTLEEKLHTHGIQTYCSKVELLQLNQTQFPSLGFFVSKNTLQVFPSKYLPQATQHRKQLSHFFVTKPT